MSTLDPTSYTIAWIAPLAIEARAAVCLLDREHSGRFPMQRGDDYVFQAGEICGHNVVIATQPAGQPCGAGSVAALASQIKKYFPNLWFGLLVGIAAGLPKLSGPSSRDIRLGDVLVALPDAENAGLIAYDLNNKTNDDFQLLRDGHVLAVTETVARAAIGNIRLRAPDDVNLILPYYNSIRDKRHQTGTFGDPGQDLDRLYSGDYARAKILQERKQRLDEQRTRIWYGPIGSGEKLLENAARRDELRDRYNVIGLETGAAGAMVSIPVGVIRGVCDYGDGYTSNAWQPYAAAMAAAYAKAVLAQIGPRGSTSVYHIPFRRNRSFRGREPQIDNLKRMLFTEGTERVAVLGLGGMGKTQIALELAYRVQDMTADRPQHQCSVFWMPAQSLAAFRQAAMEVAIKLKLSVNGSEDAAEVLQHYLSLQTNGQWLLILDNIDEASVLCGEGDHVTGLSNFLPISETGRILITTRSSEVAVKAQVNSVVNIEAMCYDEAFAMLEAGLFDKSQLKSKYVIGELLQNLTHLPLAIAQASAYINQTATPITEYLRLLSSTDQNAMRLLEKKLSNETYHSETQGTVARTWIISFTSIFQENAGAARLLSFIRWISCRAIPRGILPVTGSETHLTDSIGAICKLGFMTWRADDQILDMNRLVHLALRLWLEETQTQAGLMTEKDVVEHLSAIFPSKDWGNRFIWRQYLPHVLPLVKEGILVQDKSLMALAFRASVCLSIDGRWREEVEILEHLAAVSRETLAEDHPDRLAFQHALAVAYYNNGQIKESVKMLEEVVAIREKILTEDHPDRLKSKHALAEAYFVDGQRNKSIKMLEEVLATRDKILAEDHPDRLDSKQALAEAYGGNKSVKMLEEVMAIRDKILAEDHPDRLNSKQALAEAYDGNASVKMLEEVVAIRDKTLTEDHPERLSSRHALAEAYHVDGQVKEAVKLLEGVVAIRDKILAKDHPDRLGSKRALAEAYQVNGQVKEAVKLLEEVVAIRVKILAKDHPDRLGSKHALAEAYQVNGQVKEAVKLLEEVVAIRVKILAKDHPDRLDSKHALARAYQDNGQVKEAVKMLEEVVTMQKTLAKDHPSRLASQYTLGVVYRCIGKAKESVKILEEVVAIEEKALAEGHFKLLGSQSALGAAYRDNSQVQEALGILTRVVTIEGKTLADDHPSRLDSQHKLAVTYLANSQVKEAVDILEEVVAIRGRTLAKDHPNRLATQRALGEAYQANGQVKEAVKLLEEVVTIYESSLPENDLDLSRSQYALGVAYHADGQLDKSIDLLEKVLSIEERLLPADNLGRLRSQFELGVAYQANGQVDKSIDLLEKVLSIEERLLAEDHPDRLCSQRALLAARDARAKVRSRTKRKRLHRKN